MKQYLSDPNLHYSSEKEKNKVIEPLEKFVKNSLVIYLKKDEEKGYMHIKLNKNKKDIKKDRLKKAGFFIWLILFFSKVLFLKAFLFQFVIIHYNFVDFISSVFIISESFNLLG